MQKQNTKRKPNSACFHCLPRCFLSVRERQQASGAECTSSNESPFNKQTFLATVVSLTHAQNYLRYTYRGDTCTKEWSGWEPAAKSWSQQPGQLTRQQQPDGTAGVVSFCYKVAMGWHKILPLDCFQSCLPNGEPVQLPALQEGHRQVFTLQTKCGLQATPAAKPHTQCQVQRATKIFLTLQYKQ